MEGKKFFIYLLVFGEPEVHFHNFLLRSEVSLRPSAIPGGNPPGDWQSALGWGDARFEPGTAGLQSGTLPLSHHASLIEPTRLPHLATKPPKEPSRHPKKFCVYVYVGGGGGAGCKSFLFWGIKLYVCGGNFMCGESSMCGGELYVCGGGE
jgi:hypothetical protein